jgi:hypothetical protein
MPAVIHALTIDVEDYYSIYRRDLFGVEGPPTDAVVRNTNRVLERLARRQGHVLHAGRGGRDVS